MKKHKINTKSGITLIALVVTIIVLLLLAGISIQMLTGNNGILSRVGESKQRTEEEQIIEEAKIEILSTQTSKLTGKMNEKELKSILSKYGTLSTEENIIDKKLTTTNGDYVIPVSKIYNGNILNATIENTDSKNYYGDLIDYDVDIGVSLDDKDQYDWKIFYKDGTNIYIIAEDYVSMDKCQFLTESETKRALDSTKPYSLYWTMKSGDPFTVDNNKAGSVDIFGNSASVGTKYIANKYLKQWKTVLDINESDYTNAKVVATLIDTNLWRNFASSTKVNELTNKPFECLATGGPTLEMWVYSWNEKYSNDLIYCDKATKIGYYLKYGSSPTSTSMNNSYIDYTIMQSKEGYSDTLYYPHPVVNNQRDSFSTTNGLLGYWLVSPSGLQTPRIIIVKDNGSVNHNYYYDSSCGVRPVVCLPSDITATWNETDGVWNIIKK